MSNLRQRIVDLERTRNSKVLVYCVGDSPGKVIAANDVPALAGALRRLGRVKSLDLVLHTEGGSLSAAHRVAVLLRDYCDRFNVLVPYKARSAGTLVCLAANEIVMGPVAELSPLDPIIFATNKDASPAGPNGICSEEVREFVEMSRNWFGLRTASERMQALKLLTERIHPASLSSLYRADRYVYQVGTELLAFQLPRLPLPGRRRIVQRLIQGYAAHHHGIAFGVARRLGLKARAASAEEEPLLWDLYAECQQYINQHRSSAGQDGHLGAIIAVADEVAHFVTRKYVAPESAITEALHRPASIGAWGAPESLV